MSQPLAIPTIDVREADRRRRAGDPKPVTVDVREASEFADVRLEDDVVLLPMSEFAARYEELPRDRPLIMMCAGGTRSAAATGHLLRNGYTDVVNVAGGIKDWETVGLPVRRGPVQPGEGQVEG
jgi:rhodanese-related sulfurtransferase